MGTFLTPALKSSQSGFSLVNDRTGQPVVTQLELAVDSVSRRKGLLGRDGLAENTGIVIAPTNAVHTFFMTVSTATVNVTYQHSWLLLRPMLSLLNKSWGTTITLTASSQMRKEM